VKSPLAARAAILLALAEPGYGLQIIDRIRARTGGRVRLRLGSVYPALRALERQRLLRSWEVPAAKGGRRRRYYELTVKGVEAATGQRELVRDLLGPPAEALTPETVNAMRDRLAECAAVSAFVQDLRRRMLEVTGGRG
jgi:PadR family transcriptional regulator, regulatory protein PadR